MVKKATIKEIAEKAKVSKGAVWAALREQSCSVRMAPATRERIRKIASDLNYRPNILGRSLIHRKSFLLGFIFNVQSWHIGARLIQSIQSICHRSGYSLIVYPSSGLDEERRSLELAVERHLDGILTIPLIDGNESNASEYRRIAANTMPVVQLIFKLCPELSFVGRDYRQIGADAVAYLAARGHRRIGLVPFDNYKDPLHGWGAFLLHQGYREAMSRLGLPAEVYPFGRGEGNLGQMDNIHDDMELILESSYSPTALIANSSSLAYGMIARLRECGMRVSEDLSIISCGDDMEQPRCLAPRLTLFRIPFREIAGAAVEKCLQLSDCRTPDEIYLKQKIEAGITVCRNLGSRTDVVSRRQTEHSVRNKGGAIFYESAPE